MVFYETFRKFKFDPNLCALQFMCIFDTNYEILKGCVWAVTSGPPCIKFTKFGMKTEFSSECREMLVL